MTELLVEIKEAADSGRTTDLNLALVQLTALEARYDRAIEQVKRVSGGAFAGSPHSSGWLKQIPANNLLDHWEK